MIRVVAGILQDESGQVLISERMGDSPFVGLWEFPGGKIETGETLDTALQREIAEELGVSILQWSHLLQVTHHYQDRSIEIDFFLVSSWQGTPLGIEGQAIRWLHTSDLRAEDLLPADAPVIDSLQTLS